MLGVDKKRKGGKPYRDPGASIVLSLHVGVQPRWTSVHNSHLDYLYVARP